MADKIQKNPSGLNVPAKELPKIEKPRKDWRNSFHWRVFRIMAEFVDGFQFVTDFKKTVTFFGSARLPQDDHWYREAQKLGRILARAGFGIITGGGPGIMEAANRGAVEGKGDSVGLNIQLPFEQRINPFVRKAIGFHYFFTRKVMLSYSAQAYVFFPGGYGTLDEAFEILTLIQTKKIYEKIPVVLVGKDFWGTLDRWMKEKLVKDYQTIDAEDLKLYYLVDTAEEAFEIIKKSKPREEF
ncbi:MAG: TIGR00730 family Rossman fold protein [Candidatus Harrisonbacteria bacterium]|nr:TIGR00730 family Rossman fold protein [Candidatus Harrisonbacteria bacterium]